MVARLGIQGPVVFTLDLLLTQKEMDEARAGDRERTGRDAERWRKGKKRGETEERSRRDRGREREKREERDEEGRDRGEIEERQRKGEREEIGER